MSEILNFWENLENLEIENFKINFSTLFMPQFGMKMIPYEPPEFFTHLWSDLEKLWKLIFLGENPWFSPTWSRIRDCFRNPWKSFIFTCFSPAIYEKNEIFKKKFQNQFFFLIKFFIFFFRVSKCMRVTRERLGLSQPGYSYNLSLYIWLITMSGWGVLFPFCDFERYFYAYVQDTHW